MLPTSPWEFYLGTSSSTSHSDSFSFFSTTSLRNGRLLLTMRRKLSIRVLTAIFVLVAFSLIAFSSHFLSGPPEFAVAKSIVHAWSHSPIQSPTNTSGEHRVSGDIVLRF